MRSPYSGRPGSATSASTRGIGKLSDRKLLETVMNGSYTERDQNSPKTQSRACSLGYERSLFRFGCFCPGAALDACARVGDRLRGTLGGGHKHHSCYNGERLHTEFLAG